MIQNFSSNAATLMPMIVTVSLRVKREKRGRRNTYTARNICITLEYFRQFCNIFSEVTWDTSWQNLAGFGPNEGTLVLVNFINLPHMYLSVSLGVSHF